MEILFILVPLSVLLISIAVGVFIWAVRSGQFDDLDSPAWRILVDDRVDSKPATKNNHRNPGDDRQGKPE